MKGKQHRLDTHSEVSWDWGFWEANSKPPGAVVRYSMMQPTDPSSTHFHSDFQAVTVENKAPILIAPHRSRDCHKGRA